MNLGRNRAIPPFVLYGFFTSFRLSPRACAASVSNRAASSAALLQFQALRLSTQPLQDGAQVLGRQEVGRGAEEGLAPPVVITAEQLLQQRRALPHPGHIRLNPEAPRLSRVPRAGAVRDEGIALVKALVAGAGVLGAVPAEFRAAMFQGAARDGAALVALPAAAAGAVAAQVHPAKAAFQPAE